MGKKKKANQYANDIWTCIKAEPISFKELLNETEKYCNFTGLKVNYNKSNVLRIGASRNTQIVIPTDVPLNWTSEWINILGVIISSDPVITCTKNYKEILSKVKARLGQWSYRPLSPLGKIQVVNSLVASWPLSWLFTK